MYVPSHFAESDSTILAAFIGQHGFATVVTVSDGVPFASHVPILYESRGHGAVLRGHVARANPQWRQFDECSEVLVIFHGPHAYVSPRWYESPVAVPTWNYAVVHVYGRARILQEEREVEDLLRAMVAKYESTASNPWRDELPPDQRSKLVKAIVGFEIAVTRLEGKFKLSQNRSAEDVTRVKRALSESGDQTERAVAILMKRFERGADGAVS